MTDISKEMTVNTERADNSNDAAAEMAELFAGINSDDEKNRVVGGTLYLVATPIGNMADITGRAVKTLSEVDFIAAEDTRHTGILCAALGISRPMTSYYEQNKAESGRRIVERLKSGESCALCTDAGMPAISDPGADLVRLCIDAGITVTCVTGACAAVTALALSGADTNRFTFIGFLPTENKPRAAAVEDIARSRVTVILYEAPHRVRKTLGELCRVCGEGRKIALCRELTKRNEEIIRTTLAGACELYELQEPRGEYVFVIHGEPAQDTALQWRGMTVAEHVALYTEGGLGRMDALKAAARDRGVGKGEIYREITENKVKS